MKLHKEKFDLIQERIYELSDEDDLTSDSHTYESQKSDIRTHIDSIQELQMALIAYRDSFSLKNDLQKFSKRKDFLNSQALTLLERLEARQLSYDHYCYGCEHYHSLATQSSYQ